MCSSGGGLGGLDAALDTLAAQDLGGLSDLAVARRAAELQERLHRLQAELTRTVCAVHVRGAALADGMGSTQALLRSRLRLSGRAASDQVRVASALAELPDTAAAFSAGEISFEHAAAVVAAKRRLGGAAMAGGGEKLLLEEARERSAGWLHRLVRRLHEQLDPEGSQDAQRRLHEDRWLAVARTFQGAVSVQGMLDPVTGELLLSALAAYTPPASWTDGRTPGQRRVDGLAEICKAALGNPETPAPRPQVTVTVGLDTLRRAPSADGAGFSHDGARPGHGAAGRGAAGFGADAAGFGHDAAGFGHDTGAPGPDAAALGPAGLPVCAQTARRLACDAGIIPAVLGGVGEPLDIGRQTRSIPTGLRRALVLRDRGCRFPGCDAHPARTDGHHLQHWSHGGPTSLANLVLLCGFHHWLVHEGQWAIHYHPGTDTLTAARPDGTPHDQVSGPRGQPP